MYEGLYERSADRKRTQKRTKVLKAMLQNASRSDVLDRIVDADSKLKDDPMLRDAVKAWIEEHAPAIREDRRERIDAEDYKRLHYKWWTVWAWRDDRTVGVKFGPLSVWTHRHRRSLRRCLSYSWMC